MGDIYSFAAIRWPHNTTSEHLTGEAVVTELVARTKAALAAVENLDDIGHFGDLSFSDTWREDAVALVEEFATAMFNSGGNWPEDIEVLDTGAGEEWIQTGGMSGGSFATESGPVVSLLACLKVCTAAFAEN